jgi:hypothetical protein
VPSFNVSQGDPLGVGKKDAASVSLMSSRVILDKKIYSKLGGLSNEKPAVFTLSHDWL